MFEEQMNNEVGTVVQEPLEETEETVEREEEEDGEEGGSLFLPITGLLVVILCEAALFLTSLSHGYTIFSSKEL